MNYFKLGQIRSGAILWRGGGKFEMLKVPKGAIDRDANKSY